MVSQQQTMIGGLWWCSWRPRWVVLQKAVVDCISDIVVQRRLVNSRAAGAEYQFHIYSTMYQLVLHTRSPRKDSGVQEEVMLYLFCANHNLSIICDCMILGICDNCDLMCCFPAACHHGYLQAGTEPAWCQPEAQSWISYWWYWSWGWNQQHQHEQQGRHISTRIIQIEYDMYSFCTFMYSSFIHIIFCMIFNVSF